VRANGLRRYKRLLLDKRDELSTADEAATPVPAADEPGGDLIDRASADSEADLQVCVHQSRPHLLRAIEDALSRIRRGTFGVGDTCKQPISRARLEAVPWTHLCTKCKEQRA